MTRDIRTMPLYQSDASHNVTLRELKRRAAAGVHLHAYDDITRGSKNTECTLGLCDDKIEAMRDGVYPQPEGHNCPHDARYFTKTGEPIHHGKDPNGCFHTCRIFQRKYAGGSAVERIKAVPLIPEVRKASRPTPEDA